MQYGKLGIVYLQEQLKNTGFILKDRKLQTLQKPTTHDALCRSLYR
jgi:hypothetical protein